jgi:Phytanoyl-CoA dioxygenase (PhyH)
MILLIGVQKLLLKLRRRFLQYSAISLQQPQWLLMFTFSRIHLVRSQVLRFTQKPVKLDLIDKNSVFSELDVDRVVKALKNDGLHLGITIPPHLLEEILDFAQTATYLGNGDSQFPFLLADRKAQEIESSKNFRIGYNFDPAFQCMAIRKLAADPKLWEIAAKYFDSQPMLACTQLWWTFVNDAPAEGRAQGFYRFHYDLEDYACVKFMFYLTDVDLTGGPHVCVKGSHQKKKLSHQLSLLRERNDPEIKEYYGDENVVTIFDRAGVGFAEDPFCFHKGILPEKSDRLILEFKFTLNNYGIIL